MENFHDSFVCEDCDCIVLFDDGGCDCDQWEDYEDDGQPDEMQEWHDFDPDC
tara:strand:+ start:310 stop:465 length:156 start_codon:yes stop_codon:yes gene_type:complete